MESNHAHMEQFTRGSCSNQHQHYPHTHTIIQWSTFSGDLLAKSKMPTSQRYMSTYGYVPKEDLRKVRILYLDQGIYSTNSSNTFGTTLPTELSMKALSHHWNPRSCASVALKLRSEKFHAETWGWHESRWWSESYGGSAEWLHEVTNPWARFSMVTNDQPSMAMIIES